MLFNLGSIAIKPRIGQGRSTSCAGARRARRPPIRSRENSSPSSPAATRYWGISLRPWRSAPRGFRSIPTTPSCSFARRWRTGKTASRPGRGALAAHLDPQAARAVLQRRRGDLRPLDPAKPRRSGPGGGRPAAGGLVLAHHPGRMPGRPGGHRGNPAARRRRQLSIIRQRPIMNEIPRRLLFAFVHSYVDPSSGAAMATRDVLELMASRGWECRRSRPVCSITMWTPLTTWSSRPGAALR